METGSFPSASAAVMERQFAVCSSVSLYLREQSVLSEAGTRHSAFTPSLFLYPLSFFVTLSPLGSRSEAIGSGRPF